MPFYLRHLLILVEHADEMEFGLQQEPQLWLPSLEEFINVWRFKQSNAQRAIALMNPQTFANLQKQNLTMRVIAQDPRRVMVSNLPTSPLPAEHLNK